AGAACPPWTSGLARLLVLALALALALLAPLTPPAHAQSQAAAPSAKPAGLPGAVLDQLADAEQKLIALARATPADKLGGRPASGLRSAAEVLLHVAAANYDIATAWGVKPPAGADMDAARGIGKGGAADKAKAIAALEASFAHLRKAVSALAEKD